MASNVALPIILRRVAAMAIADKWAEAEIEPTENTIWADLFPDAPQRDAALRVAGAWVY